MIRSLLISSILIFTLACDTKVSIPVENKLAFPIRLKGKISSDSLFVGSKIDMKFPIKNRSVDSVFMIWSSAFGDVLIEGDEQNEQLCFSVPHELTLKSGDVNLYLYNDQKKIDEFEIHLKPLSAVGNMESGVGPSSLLLDQGDLTMLSLIPRDKYNNPMPDGKEAQIFYKYPGEQQIEEKIVHKDFIATRVLSSQKKKGKLFIGAKCDQAYAHEEEVVLAAGAAQNFTISVIEHYPFAESRQHLVLRSNEIKDKLGNTIADGTKAVFKISDQAQKTSFYHAIVVDGVCTLDILNPDEPGLYKIQAFILHTAKSNTLQLAFSSVVNEIPKTYDPLGQIVFGPVRGKLNQLIPDGTPGLLLAANENFELEFNKGKAFFEKPDDLLLLDDEWVIKVLGITDVFNPKDLINE